MAPNDMGGEHRNSGESHHMPSQNGTADGNGPFRDPSNQQPNDVSPSSSETQGPSPPDRQPTYPHRGNAAPDLEAGPKTKQMLKREREFREPLSFKDRAVRVTWAWFPSTISTGGLAVLLGNQPFTFTGLTVIGKIWYIFNICLFLCFTSLIAVRFIRKPRALTTSLHHPSESFFFGAWCVAIGLIINGAQVYGGPSTGPWFTTFIRVAFWMYYAYAMCVAVLQYHIIFEVEKLAMSEAVPAWILPAYPFLITGALAATIAEHQPQDHAIRILIAGLMGQGLGWILSLFIYVVYLTRLINHNMPPPSTRPGMFMSVGPAAFTTLGLISLGMQAKEIIPDDYLGITSVPVGELWMAISVPAGLFLWLVAIWFFALSAVSVIRIIPRMTFSPQWWVSVFPNVGLTLATAKMGEALESDGIKIFAVVLTITLIIIWFVCAIGHVRAVMKRQILAVGKDIGVEEVNRRHDEKKMAGRWLESNKRDI